MAFRPVQGYGWCKARKLFSGVEIKCQLPQTKDRITVITKNIVDDVAKHRAMCSITAGSAKKA